MNSGLILSNVAQTILLPPFSLFLLLLVGWLLGLRWRRLGRWVIGTTLVLSFALSTVAGSNLLVRPLEALTAPLSTSGDAGAQAIVVLSAGRLRRAPEYGGADIPDTLALGRLRYAARLQHQTGLPILVSGGVVAWSGKGPSYASAMATALREDFVTPVRWLEEKSQNTAENAIESASMLRRDGVTRVLLVTDAMHMPRSERQFQRAGLAVVAAPTMFFGSRSAGPFDLLPSAEGLRRSYYALYEWIGLLWYRIRYP